MALTIPLSPQQTPVEISVSNFYTQCHSHLYVQANTDGLEGGPPPVTSGSPDPNKNS